ncbi:zinc finger protein 888-like isoform X5 [Saccostrea cucullata]|uniref:zinc finger protein 888-like isoform X5 n=1 Tax=Saccostrea cuccullata TaxID=36930 RepID=UPI002ED1FAFA
MENTEEPEEFSKEICLDPSVNDIFQSDRNNLGKVSSKRKEHFIQINFGESSAFEIRETGFSISSKEDVCNQHKNNIDVEEHVSKINEAKCVDDIQGQNEKERSSSQIWEERSTSQNEEERSPSQQEEERSPSQNEEERSQSQNLVKETEKELEGQETENSAFTQDQSSVVNAKGGSETSTKKRTINMIVSDILKNKETSDKEKAEDDFKGGSRRVDKRKESQPKKRRKARNPVNITYSEDSLGMEEDSVEEEEETYKCEVCFVRFNRQADLTEHYMMHKDEGDYSYVYNGKTFETTPFQQNFIESYIYSTLKDKSTGQEGGSLTNDQNIPESQKIGAYSTQSTVGEGSEMIKTEIENPLQCDYCDKAFSSTLLLKRHISVHTGERPYKCDVCEKTFNLPHHLKTHARIHTNVRPYKCEVCGRAFNESSSLKRHSRIHAKERPYIYICDVCGKTFNEPHNLRTHVRIHSDVKPYTCGVCKKAFIRQQTLKNHMRIHTDERPYKCEVCEKAFKELHHLKIHVRIHTDIRPYKCDICEKTFNERSSLKRHVRIHTGEKPYKCTLCEKAFNHNESLKIHLRHHTGERPFKCEICDKTFTDPKNYKSHQKIHKHDNRFKFKCDSCDKSFTEESRLWQHMRIHTGNLPFKCMICSKAFNQKSSLKRHLKAIHPGIQMDMNDKDLLSSNTDESDETMDSPADEDFDEGDESADDFTGISGVVNEPPETSSSFHIMKA